jgi:hypothetical protein
MSDATSTSVVRTVGEESNLICLVLTVETVANANRHRDRFDNHAQP